MQCVIVFVVAVFTPSFSSDVHHGGASHQALMNVINQSQCLFHSIRDQDVYDLIYVKYLTNNGSSCKAEFYCQAEKVLSVVNFRNISSTCSVNKLLRNLQVCSKANNCTVPNKGDEIIIRSFLSKLTNCAKQNFQTLKVPAAEHKHQNPVAEYKTRT